MAKKKLSIDDLLNSLKNPNTPEKKEKLANTKETWTRIGEGDSFSELGLQSSELDDFLKEWIEENPYMNI
jgi:hypothetical protein